MADSPYPGARACPVCWDDPSEGRHTATFNGVTHRSQACATLCLRLGVGDWNIDVEAERLDGAPCPARRHRAGRVRGPAPAGP